LDDFGFSVVDGFSLFVSDFASGLGSDVPSPAGFEPDFP
jgi:hypothetical protein